MPELSPRSLFEEGCHVLRDQHDNPVAWILTVPSVMGHGYAQFSLWPRSSGVDGPWSTGSPLLHTRGAPASCVQTILDRNGLAEEDVLVLQTLWIRELPGQDRGLDTQEHPPARATAAPVERIRWVGEPLTPQDNCDPQPQAWRGWIPLSPVTLSRARSQAAGVGLLDVMDYLQRLLLYWLQRPMLELFDAGTTEITLPGGEVVGYAWLNKSLHQFNLREAEHVVLVETLKDSAPSGIAEHPPAPDFELRFRRITTSHSQAQFYAFAKTALTGADQVRIRTGTHKLHVIFRMKTSGNSHAGSRRSVFGPYARNLGWSYWDKTGPWTWDFFYHSWDSSPSGTVHTSAATISAKEWRNQLVNWPSEYPRISTKVAVRVQAWSAL